MFLYSISMHLLVAGLKIASHFHAKARQGVVGRKNWRQKLQSTFPVKKPVVWVHCASLGEFEQGLPIMEALKKEFPDIFLLITFFSPSGYEHRKNTPIADYVCYVPFDTQKNARDFVEITRPDVVFFVKYEFWFHLINVLQQRKIATFFISSLFRPTQYFFKKSGRWTWKYLQSVEAFFVQNQQSKTLLENIGVKKVIVSGDTRFDRTLKLSENPQQLPIIEQFKWGKRLLVGGSTWPPEESMLQTLVEKNLELKLIIAPHDVSESHLQAIENLFSDICIRYSQATPENINKFNILIIDGIGLLSKIYFYADMALIGGAFGSGLHNILEALTYGASVFFGYKTKKFPEAQQAIDAGCGFKIHDAQEFINSVEELLHNSEHLKSVQEKSRNFVKNNAGATSIIMDGVRQKVKSIL